MKLELLLCLNVHWDNLRRIFIVLTDLSSSQLADNVIDHMINNYFVCFALKKIIKKIFNLLIENVALTFDIRVISLFKFSIKTSTNG